MFEWARNLFGRTGGTAARGGTPVTARYDNAATTPENRRAWWAVDYLSAKASNSYAVRRMLRNRSRYEVSNNPYLFGIVNGNADDLVGTGPTLQVMTPDAAYNRAVEAAFNEWADEVNLVEKLRTCKLARSIDGEGFLILKTAESLDHPVKLYPVDVEADQVTAAAPSDLSELWVDGLVLDPVTERPTAYHVLSHHPGDYYFPDFNPYKATKVAAAHVVHWFPKFRPGQVRGVPVFTPSLDLFTELRAFRRAVVKAAETAADFAVVLQQELAAADDDINNESADPAVKPFTSAPINRGMMTVLPAGMKMGQMAAAHPTTTYEMFQEKCLGEAVRPMAYPLNLALGTSQKFNFSSAKLDHINYRGGLTVERGECERVVLRKVFRAWWEEAVREGVVDPFDGLKPPPVVWHWPGFASLDPLVDAQADAATLAGGQQTWREFWAKRGKDHREVFAQLRDEKRLLDSWGLSFGDVVKRAVTVSTDDDPTDPDPTEARRGEPANAA